MHPHPSRQPGLTMIELLVVLVISAILASIAWPAYQNQVMRGRRSDAMSALAAVSQAQERWRSESPVYIAELPVALSVSQGGHYDVAVVENSTTESAYSIKATAKDSSPQINDTACRSLLMSLSAGRITYTSANSGGANGTPDPCWVR